MVALNTLYWDSRDTSVAHNNASPKLLLSKVADRPHGLTILATFAGVALSVVSLAVAGWSLHETWRNARIARQPYLRATVQFPSSIRRLQDLSPEAMVRVPMLARILNHGGSRADDIALQYRITLNGRVLRDIKEKLTAINNRTGQTIGVSIEPTDEMTYSMYLEISAGEFRAALSGGNNLTVCTQVSYRDIDGSQAAENRCDTMRDEPSITVVK